MDQKIWLPLITLIGGWLLSEIAQAARRRAGRKEPIRQVLADLLELRHGLIAHHFLFSQLARRLNVPAGALNELRRSLPTPEQRDPTLKERFGKALSDLAKHDPIHAFRLRGKDVMGLVDVLLTAAEGSSDDLARFADQTRQTLYDEVLPEFDQTVLATAWKAGIPEWIAVKRLTKRGPVSKGVIEATERLIQPLVEKLAASGVAVRTESRQGL